MAAQQDARELDDFEKRPVTDEEVAAWSALTDEQQSLFGGRLGMTFRWIWEREGERFPLWLETAVTLRREARVEEEQGVDGPRSERAREHWRNKRS